MTSRLNKKVSALHAAIKSGDRESVSKLLQENSEEALEICQHEVPQCGTSLHLAAECADPRMLQLLLSVGVSVDQRQSGHVISGLTPLHVAASAGMSDNVEFLLSRQANPNAKDSDGHSPLHNACQDDDKLVIVKMLLANGTDINSKNNLGLAPVQISILRAPAICKHLIASGADIMVTDKEGQTLLHYAAEWENEELVQLLINKGVDVNLQDHQGRSPLHLTSDENIMQILIQNGGDTSLRDKLGKPPIEGHIDTEKEEFKHLNEVLGKRQQDMKQGEGNPPFFSVKAEDIQEKYNKLTKTPSAGKQDLFSELKSKVKIQDGDTDNGGESTQSKYKPSPLAAAGVLSELKTKRSPTSQH